MARMLIADRWFESLSPTLQFEAEFERILESKAHLLFPDWILLPFKIDVFSQEGRKKPDFALIDKCMRSWWVVEVEMARHDLYNHVVPQARVLKNGTYDSRHAEYLAQHVEDDLKDAVRALVRSTPPEVWIVVDRVMPDWAPPLRALDVRLGVVEIFLSDRNEHSLRVNGEQPRLPDGVQTICRLNPSLSRLWRVESPAVLPIGQSERLVVSFSGEDTAWERLDLAGEVYIRPVVGNPLGEKQTVRLVNVGTEQWIFR